MDRMDQLKARIGARRTRVATASQLRVSGLRSYRLRTGVMRVIRLGRPAA
jgi:hypothetical protein